MSLEEIKDLPLAVVILAIIIGPVLSAVAGVLSSWWQFRKSQKTDTADADVKVSDAALRIVKELQSQMAINKEETAQLRGEVKEMNVRMDQLQQENLELKMKAEMLTSENSDLKTRVHELELENEKLKAEIQRLKEGKEC